MKYCYVVGHIPNIGLIVACPAPRTGEGSFRQAGLFAKGEQGQREGERSHAMTKDKKTLIKTLTGTDF